MLTAISPGWFVPSGKPIGQRKALAQFVIETRFGQFTDQHLAFRLTANNPEVG